MSVSAPSQISTTPLPRGSGRARRPQQGTRSASVAGAQIALDIYHPSLIGRRAPQSAPGPSATPTPGATAPNPTERAAPARAPAASQEPSTPVAIWPTARAARSASRPRWARAGPRARPARAPRSRHAPGLGGAARAAGGVSWVNPKQSARALKERALKFRAWRARGPALIMHMSRARHACNRQRDANGRFPAQEEGRRCSRRPAAAAPAPAPAAPPAPAPPAPPVPVPAAPVAPPLAPTAV